MKNLSVALAAVAALLMGGCSSSDNQKAANDFVVCFSGGTMIYQNEVRQVEYASGGTLLIKEGNGRKLGINGDCVFYYE